MWSLSTRLLAGCCLASLLVACTSGPGAPETGNYAADLTAFRTARDEQFRTEKDPIPANRKDTLLPLRYFPPDESYVVPAQLKLADADNRPRVTMPTSTGTQRRYQTVGVLEFTLQNQNMSLGAFVEDGQPIVDLFVPFVDTTSGAESYPAGRYLDLHPTGTGLYTIDFNKAYNPYCAYNDTYECPYPPPSNRLKVAIRAGEKKPGA
ncbi:MAG TPA: DUF1684 domain-containing protein [Vicinamibacterales bacterium]